MPLVIPGAHFGTPVEFARVNCLNVPTLGLMCETRIQFPQRCCVGDLKKTRISVTSNQIGDGEEKKRKNSKLDAKSIQTCKCYKGCLKNL